MRNRSLQSLFCAGIVFGCISCGSSSSNRGGRSNSNDNSQNSAIAIIVGKSEARDVASTIDATGTLVAMETSDVAPKVAGKISNIYVNVGQFVAGGAIIAKVDDRDAKLQLASAQAAVK